MSSKTVIKLNNVSKLYFKQGTRTFKELIPALIKGQKAGEWFWALENISLEIKAGETLGIIGPNGSGKSTLLKLIAGVSTPTKGTLAVSGRVAPLIELGAGFHPELTGRENIYLNGVILGMSRSEVAAKFTDIVNFAELWDFIDQPVKHYSSGMYLRLAFSVAINVEADVLLIDEVLAVGDQNFREKCYQKLSDLQKKGVTILLVSHTEADIKKFCDKAALIVNSKLIAYDGVEKVLAEYERKSPDKV
jgi:ABC-type polysaccharide/polyol phosphate transport system ATPase subunit